MILSVKRIVSDDFLTKYDVVDMELVPTRTFVRNFGDPSDYVEAHIYSFDNTLIFSDQKYIGYKLPASAKAGDVSTVNSLIFEPGEHLEKLGYLAGIYKISYNIFRRKIYNSSEKPFFIKEISNDRTEVRLASNIISNLQIEEGVLNFINEIQSVPYYKDFLLNFGDNNIVNAVNIALDKNGQNYTVLVKLYKPLDSQFKEKDPLWIVEELSESYTYQVELAAEVVPTLIPFLKSANFDVEYKKTDLISSDYFNIESLFYNNSTTAYQRLLNELSSKQVKINIDYSDFSNFVHFSSAKERVLNFVYKLSLIETYEADLSLLKSVPNYTGSTSVSYSIVDLQNKVNKVIEKFDGYENYLYYSTSSTAWPKSNNNPPYTLYSSTSSQAISWLGSDDSFSSQYGGILLTASVYDNENTDNLNFSSPEFINIDPTNDNYQLFLNMIGQHFDNIWVYIKSISDIYDSRNNPTKGVSRDLVYQVLKALGTKLYNASGNDNIFDYLIGSDPSGSYYPVSESNQTLITASAYNVSGLDYNTEIYKRIYHNINYLSKTKGTSRALKALISAYGIPSTILDVVNYGGSDKTSQTVEYKYDRFTYKLNNENTSYIRLYWAPLTANYIKYGVFDRVADAIEFRFKPSNDIIKSQQVLLASAPTASNTTRFAVWMDYTSSNGVPSAKVSFGLSGSLGFKSASVVAPIFNKDNLNETRWWNLMIKREDPRGFFENSTPQTYYLYLKNKIGDNLGHEYSASIYVSGSGNGASYNRSWTEFGTTASYHYLYVGGCNFSSSFFGLNNSFVGSLQELRLWAEPLSESVFDHHVLNPESYQGNYTSSAYEFLAARFPLGNNLLTYNHYLTQSLTPVQPNYSLYYSSGSFNNGTLYGVGVYGYGIYGGTGSVTYSISVNSASFYNYSNTNNYSSFTEEYYAVSPNSGYSNPVTEKIRISSDTGSSLVLSPDLSFQQKEYRTKDIHFTDVSFSPQNEVDKDIIAQYGDALNLDDYIGNPLEEYSSIYVELNHIKQEYFLKYISRYSYQELIRLVKIFDGSLFKMIKDFVPARTNIQTGFTLRSPLLERNRVQRHRPVFESEYNYLTASLSTSSIEADTEHHSNIGDGRDFYTGELTSSSLDVNELFEEKNYNPYARFTASLDIAVFSKSDFNVLYANISESITSSYIRTKDLLTTRSVTYPSEVQDYYYTYKRHSYPRYEGSRLVSAYYNEYNVNDIAYNKESNVNINVDKFAWVNKIYEKNLNFYDKTTLSIKYLIDSSSNAYQLTRENKNLFESQNLFKSGQKTTLVLFDPFSPSVQVGLAGVKEIWKGGFSYSPVIYNESTNGLLFKYTVPKNISTNTVLVKAVATSGSSWKNVYNTEADFSDPPGGGDHDQVAGWPQVNYGPISLISAYSLAFGYFSTWKYQSKVPIGFTGYIRLSNGNLLSVNFVGTDKTDQYRWFQLDYILPYVTSSAVGGYIDSQLANTLKVVEAGSEKYVQFTAPFESLYELNLTVPFSFYANHGDSGAAAFKLVGILERMYAGQTTWVYEDKTYLQPIDFSTDGLIGFNEASSFVRYDPPGSEMMKKPLRGNIILKDKNIYLGAGDKLRVKYYFLEIGAVFRGGDKITFEIYPGNDTQGYWQIKALNQDVRTLLTDFIIDQSDISYTKFVSASADDLSTLIFSPSASMAYNNTIFTTQSVGGISPVADRYSDIYYPFTIQAGDLIRFGTFFSNNPAYYTVKTVFPPVLKTDLYGSVQVSSSLKVILETPLASPYDVNSKYFAILRPTPDETSVILNTTKKDGGTSKGLLIPYNLKNDIVNNTANIIDPIKQTLLLDGT